MTYFGKANTTSEGICWAKGMRGLRERQWEKKGEGNRILLFFLLYTLTD